MAQQPQTQQQMYQSTRERVFTVCRVFNEIQTGGNPLTRDEVRKLIQKRPEVYGVLEKWA